MKLNEILGTEFPIIQGGMANIATGEFAAAVSNAGALGLIGAGGMNADMLRQHIRRCRELTQKPFGVNIMLMSPFAAEVAELAAKEHVAVVTTGSASRSRARRRASLLAPPMCPDTRGTTNRAVSSTASTAGSSAEHS